MTRTSLLNLFIQERFGSSIKVIARPSDADTATLRGAAQYGLARRPLVSSVIAPRSYIMKVGDDTFVYSRHILIISTFSPLWMRHRSNYLLMRRIIVSDRRIFGRMTRECRSAKIGTLFRLPWHSVFLTAIRQSDRLQYLVTKGDRVTG